MNETNKNNKMTIFRNDRYEDVAAIIAVGCITAAVLVYMAFIVPTVSIKAPYDGKIVAVKVAKGVYVYKGEPLYEIEYKDKKWVAGKIEEKIVKKEIYTSTSGKVMEVKTEAGKDVKKSKDVLFVLEHEKGTLP
ncbi:conserved hypothetical protein [Desulfovibrionales bacterium]